MIIKKDERETKVVEGLRGGQGSAVIKTIATTPQTLNHAKMYANITLKKNCGIGYHQHIDEMEVIMINEGKALYNDDGKESIVEAGDVLICEDGHFHSITNKEDEDLIATALVITK